MPLNNNMRLLSKKEFLAEAVNRLGAALRKDEIPAPYNTYKIVGLGTTSIVYEDPTDPNSVIVLTKDVMKMEWLARNWGIEIGTQLETLIPKKQHPIRDLSGQDIYVIKCPKLYPLKPSEYRAIASICSEINRTVNSVNTWELETAVEKVISHYSGKLPDDFIEGFKQLTFFLTNYDKAQYAADLHSKNLMKTADGKIVLNDPIVAKELVDAIRKHKYPQSYR